MKAKPIPPDDTRKIGYARVSTVEQNLDLQIDALKAVGVLDDNMHVEKVSGVSSKRPKLKLAMADAREGDTFIVWRLDRLGRNAEQLYRRIRELQENGVNFRSLNENIDTSTATGKLLFGIFAVLAQFERDVTIERTKAGMKAARERGMMPGQPHKFDKAKRAEIVRRFRAGEKVRALASEYKISPTTVTNYVKATRRKAKV